MDKSIYSVNDLYSSYKQVMQKIDEKEILSLRNFTGELITAPKVIIETKNGLKKVNLIYKFNRIAEIQNEEEF